MSLLSWFQWDKIKALVIPVSASGFTAGELTAADTNAQAAIASLDARNVWEYATNPVGTISGTANCTIDAAVAAEATVTFAASANVTIVPSNFSAKRSSVHVIITNGGAATSVAYGSIKVAGGSAPSWTAAGVDEFLLYRTGDGVINLAVGRKDIKVIP
jgi:hypothetical protein